MSASLHDHFQPAPGRFAIGALNDCLKGRYTIGREIGRGGSAVVYLARDERHARDVAIKVLNPVLTNHVGVERFRREIELTARLQHPHILPLLDSGTALDTMFFATPYVDGGSLRERLARGPMSLAAALRAAGEVAQALAHAHRRGVIHLDIKPENILVSDGLAVVGDFGIARALCDECPPSSDPSAPVFGTPAYMSPEQAAGGPMDERSDVYSFACVVYELLTGAPPFSASTPAQVIGQHWSVPARPVRARRDEVPPALSDLIERALAKSPGDRPACMEEMGTLLGRVVREAGPSWPRRPLHQMSLFPLAT